MDKTNEQRANFQRGITALALLAMLKQKDMYGYQLVQELERQSGGVLKFQEGSLYPVLYKLAEGGYISDERVLVGKRMSRIYYHLEPAGEAYFAYLSGEYRAVTNGLLQILEGENNAQDDVE